MAFRDFGWVAARTFTWDAIGLVSYALVVALVETIAVFLLTLLAGLLVPNSWDMEKRTALIGSLFSIVAFWAILSQLYSLLDYPLPRWFFEFVSQSDHPFRILWGTVFVFVFLSTILPTYFILAFTPVRKAIINMFQRIGTLSSFYIALDFMGILVIVVRNLY